MVVLLQGVAMKVLALAVLAAVGLSAGAAQAGIDFAVAPIAGGETFTYTLNLTSPAHLSTDDFATIYDFGPATNIVVPAGFIAYQSLTTVTPNVIPSDDPAILNLTIQYTGLPDLNGPIVFSADTTLTGTSYAVFNACYVNHIPAGQMSSADTVYVPALGESTGAPEPASLGLLGVGAIGLLIKRRR
jgi:hypothetical protein